MVTKLIKREELKNWDYGDVCIKTFSIGERLKLGNFATSVNYNGGNPIMNDKNIDIADVNIYSLAAGIQYIKAQDNFDFFIKPNTLVEDKTKIVFNLEFEPAKYLLEQINELNNPLSNEQKKL